MKEIKVAEVKVEKDVILKDNWYYVKKIRSELGSISEILLKLSQNELEDFSEIKTRSILSRAYEIAFGMSDITSLTVELIPHLVDKDIDKLIKEYNDNCNLIIRHIINNERT